MNRKAGASLLLNVIIVFVTVGLMQCKPCNKIDISKRKIIQRAIDPSGRWEAVVDEVEYPNGLTTAAADRVSISQLKSGKSKEKLIFSEDIKPDNEKPSILWKKDKLIINISKDAYVIFSERSVDGIDVEIITH
jgi:hypothetical protein